MTFLAADGYGVLKRWPPRRRKGAPLCGTDGASRSGAPYCAPRQSGFRHEIPFPLPARVCPGRRLHDPHGAGRPGTNAATILQMARDCDAQGVALAVFPELGVSGYAISDLLQQTALLDAVEAAIDTIVAASAALLPLLLVGAPIRHLGALYNCALAIHRGPIVGRGAENPSAELSGVLRTAAFRVSGDGSEGGTITIGGAYRSVRHRPAVRRRGSPRFRRPCRDLRGHLGAQPAERRGGGCGGDVLANLSASNITIGKAETRRLLCQSQSARCLAAYLYAAAGSGRVDDGSRVGRSGLGVRERRAAGRDRTVSRWRARRRSPTSTSTCLRQERLQMGSFDTNRRRIARPWRTIGFRIDPPTDDLGLRRRIERFPFVPADVARLEQDCYEAYNIQVSGLAQRLRATGLKQGGDRRFGRAGFDPGADCLRAGVRSAGPAARRHPGLHDAGLRDVGSHQDQCAGG